MPEQLVNLENVEKTFPGAKRPALGGVSADITAGIITGLVGPDGAGKTTLMRLMAGLLVPTSGQVLVRRFSAGRENSPEGGQGNARLAAPISEPGTPVAEKNSPHDQGFLPPTSEATREFIG